MTNEKDPNGIPAGEPGSKLDDGKNRLGLVLGSFGNALWAVGEVGTYGAKKYCDHGWLSVESGVNRYSDAMLRHYFKEVTGEQNDPDTKSTSRCSYCLECSGSFGTDDPRTEEAL